MITGKNYIAGELLASGSIKFRTFDPIVNEENDWEITEATIDELNRAVNSAAKVANEYANTADEKRAFFLRKIAQNIEALGDDLLNIYQKESGLDLARARIERSRTVFQLNMFANLLETKNWRTVIIEEAEPNRAPKPKPDLRKTHKPLGPIAVFGASNFPLAYSTAGGDTASALAVGCPVIVKSHPMHAGTGELVASAIDKAAKESGMPNGVFSNLNSQGIQIGTKLVNHPGIKGVGFTGSIAGGRALMDLAAKRAEPIPVFAEMGSVNPVVISEESLKKDKEKWIATYAESITNGTGQFCTNPGLILGVNSKELDEFADGLAETLNNRESTVMLNPSIKSSFDKLRSEALQAGAKQLTIDLDTKVNYAEQTVATVSGSVFLEKPQLHYEVFGPFSLIVKCESLAELNEVINGLEGQLTGTIIAQKNEFNAFRDIVQSLSNKVGRVVYNGVPTGVEVTQAMHHGGPYPASSDARFTAVGVDSAWRWLRPVCYQNFPEELLPKELLTK